ncbi:hypothetical protein DITRI_Ditri13aG0109600 [Diplodiscus trichospermus]
MLPGVTHWQSPTYFAYYPSNSNDAGFLGEMLNAGINLVGFSWIMSTAATELEMMGTASEAALVVLLAARDKVLRRAGKGAVEKLIVYASDQTHYALQKACQIGGIHRENCRLLKANSSTKYALSPEFLGETISQDLAIGLIPFFLCATARGKVGTTSSTTVDPLLALGKIARNNEMWFHAFAGSACVCPDFRHYIDGMPSLLVCSNDSKVHLHYTMHSENMGPRPSNLSLLVRVVNLPYLSVDRSALVQALSTNPEFRSWPNISKTWLLKTQDLR